jgi:hypothetical protein
LMPRKRQSNKERIGKMQRIGLLRNCKYLSNLKKDRKTLQFLE